MGIFLTLDISNIHAEAAYLVIIYTGVFISMILDCITGVRKAMLRHEATTSKGFRRTAIKAQQYFMPMMCLTIVDIIASAFFSYPFFTMIMGVFNIYIELRSIWENTHSLEETEKNLKCAKELIDFVAEHREDIERLIIR